MRGGAVAPVTASTPCGMDRRRARPCTSPAPSPRWHANLQPRPEDITHDSLPDLLPSPRLDQEAYRGADSRMGQELLRRHVLRVLRAWRGWFVFSDDFLAGLQATFLTAPTGPSELRAAHDAALAAELAALGDDDLEARCRGLGVSVAGGRADRLARLQAVLEYQRGWTGGEAGRRPSRAGRGRSGGGGRRGRAAQGRSRLHMQRTLPF